MSKIIIHHAHNPIGGESSTEYNYVKSHKTQVSQVGGVSKSRKIQRIRNGLEDAYMAIAFKANRAENQREARRNKR